MLKLEKTTFREWKHCLKLSNDSAELIICVELGPRIISYRSRNGENFLKVFEEQIANPDPSGQEWLSFGGHRLWMAPEIFPRTYYPDYEPVAYTFEDGILTLDCKTESTTFLQKKIVIEMDQFTSRVRLRHYVYNRSCWPVEFAPWALTVMAPGGRAIIPQEPYVPHGKESGESFALARPLVLWQFTNMADPRFVWGEKYVQMSEDSRCESKQKIGVANKVGFVAYDHGGELFVKKQPYVEGGTYPDNGCNAEFFTMPGMLEIESLGEYKSIAPGGVAQLDEEWNIYPVKLGRSEDEIERQLETVGWKRTVRE